MTLDEAALVVARQLFPDDESSGEDCMAEVGREGQPCRIFQYKVDDWNRTVS